MKKTLSLLLALSIVLGLCSVTLPRSHAAQVPEFTDVKSSDWFYEFVMVAAEHGLVNGVTATTFAPNNNITRAQFAVILYRQLGSPSIAGLDNPFTDLTASWYKDAVIYMAHKGVINGLTKTTFGPSKNITREQMVTMLYRMQTDPPAGGDQISRFQDGKSVSSYAVPAMNCAIRQGIISGNNKGQLTPQGNATRAQAAKVICVNFSLSRESEKEVTIRFWQAGGETEAAADTMRQLLDKFEVQNPGIKVEYTAIPWSEDPHTKFQTAIEEGNCADLLVMGSPLDFFLAEEDKLLALDDLLIPQVLADIPEFLVEQCRYGGSRNPDMAGKIISVPLYTSTRALMYNKEIFDFFGVPYPEETMTHAEMLEVAKKVTGDMNGTKVYGYGTRITSSEQYLHFVWNYGAQLIDPYTMTAATDSEAWKMGIQDYMSFYEAGVVPEDAVDLDSYSLYNMFKNGECAMFVGAMDYAMDLLQYEDWSEDKLGVATLPGEVYATCYAGSDVLAVPAATKHTRETALLVNFLMGTDAQVSYNKAIGFFPNVKSAIADPYFAENPVLSGFAKAVEGAHFFHNYGVPSCGSILKDALQDLLKGNITLEEYQKTITDEINNRIQEMYY